MTTTATSAKSPRKIGSGGIGRILNYVKFSIKDRRGINFTSLFFGVLGLPLTAIVGAVLMRFAAADRDNVPSLLVQLGIIGMNTSVLQILFVILFLVVGARHQFSYMFDRIKVDMKYSLPMTERERFYGDFIAGGIVPFAVYAVSGLVSVIIFLAGTSGLTWLPQSGAESYEIIRGMVFPYYAQGLLLCLFFYTFLIAVKTLCGRRTESAVSPLIFACVIPGIIYTGAALIFSDTAGAYANNIASYAINAGAVVSPLGYVVYVCTRLAEDMGNSTTAISSPVTTVLACAVTVLLFFFARHMYGKRRPEHVGQPFVFKNVYTTLLLTVVLCVCMSFFGVFYATTEYGARSEYLFAFLSAQVIITAVIFFISYGVKCGGINKKNIGRGIKLYLCVFAASLVISNVLPRTDGLGLTKTLPSASAVESVDITPSFNMSMYWDSYGNDVVLKDAENIDSALAAARTYVKANVKKSYISRYAMDARYEATKQSEAFCFAEFDFLLKNGKHVTRRYAVKNDNLDPLYNLFWTDEAKRYYLDRTLRPNLMWYSRYSNSGKAALEKSEYSYSGTLTDIYVNNRTAVTREQTEQLLEAYRADVFSKTRDGVTRDAAENKIAARFDVTVRQTFQVKYGKTWSDRTVNLKILAGDINFMNKLKEFGIELPRSAPAENMQVSLMYSPYMGEQPAYWQVVRGPKFSLTLKTGEILERYSAAIPASDPMIQKLMSAAQPECAVNGVGFVVSVQDDLVLPPEYNDIARELLEKYLTIEAANDY